MGIGTGLAFIAIGAVLAFAFHFHVSGIDIHMIGWILILVGAAMLAITFAYTRPRRRGQVAEIVAADPLDVSREEERPQQDVVRPAVVEYPTPESHVRPVPRERRNAPYDADGRWTPATTAGSAAFRE